MPRLSIIIACAGDTADFEDALAAVLQNRPADCEVLVALPQKYDDPYGLSGEVVFLEAPGARDLTGLMNSAAEAARGEILHFVDCGLTVQEGWSGCITPHFDDPSVAAVAPVVLDQKGEQIVAAGVVHGAGGTRRISGKGKRFDPDLPNAGPIDGPVLQAAFYRADVFRSLGGFAEEVGPQFADVDLAMSLSAAGYRCRSEPRCSLRRSTASASAVTYGASSSFTAGRQAERFFWRCIARRGRFSTAMLHLAAAAGDFIAALPRPGAVLALAGRAAAWFEMGAYRRHRERIRQAAPGGAALSPASAAPRPGDAATAAKRVA